jgi:probable HAF family extracellular repeat protein
MHSSGRSTAVLAARIAFLCVALLAPLGLALPAEAATPAARYTITDLGTLGTGNLSVAMAINDDGVVVGYADPTADTEHGFRWSGGVMTDLGTEPGGSFSQANAINEAGQVAGTADRTPGGYGYPVRWSAAGVIKDLGGPVVNSLGVGNAIDPVGRVAGGQRPADSEGSPVAILYSRSGHPTYLGNPPDSLAAATGINAHDEVVGPGFTWHAGVLTMLPGLPGGGSGNATAVNISGQVVGSVGLASPAEGEDAALWRHHVLTDLGTIDGIQYNQANAINAAGQIVGTADPRCSPCVAPVAWLRQPGGTIKALNTLIPAGSGWTLEQANGINDSGQIVGAGLHNGNLHAYLLTPVSSANVHIRPQRSSRRAPAQVWSQIPKALPQETNAAWVPSVHR